MSQLLSPDSFEFFSRYILAGYVIIIIRSRFASTQRAKTSDLIVEAVILSLINQLVFQIAIWSLPEPWLTVFDSRALLFSEILVLPSLLGLVLGLNLSRGWNNAVLRRLSMPITQPVHRAHDYAFTHNRSAGLIILTYFDGTVVYGYFGEQSLAASDAERSDIFLERLYDVNEDGQWIELIPTRGALLSLVSVRSIEFLDEVELENGEDQSHHAG
jgi:hypothetical protein